VELVRRAASYCEPYAVVIRSKIVLLAADGLENVTVAGRLGVCVDVVSKWRKRFSENGIEGLADRKRAGRPRVFPAPVVAAVKAMARGGGLRIRLGAQVTGFCLCWSYLHHRVVARLNPRMSASGRRVFAGSAGGPRRATIGLDVERVSIWMRCS
jgi:hypothetical protein